MVCALSALGLGRSVVIHVKVDCTVLLSKTIKQSRQNPAALRPFSGTLVLIRL
jgi:hypothetical protein